MRTIIFLGAGASAAEGAPLQGNVFRDYIKCVREDPDGIRRLDKNPYAPHIAVPSFLHDLFGVDTYRGMPDEMQFPTFEEALGVLDLARLRREGFGYYSYGSSDRPSSYPNVEQIRALLVEALTLTIARSFSTAPGVHLEFVRNIAAAWEYSDTTFVTTNYDTFIDCALASVSSALDYAWTTEQFSQSEQREYSLLKLHGSLDWLRCASCGKVQRFPDSVGQMRFGTQCPMCQDFLRALVVPPTFYKELGVPVLSWVWGAFEAKLRDTDRIIFCGYSFPDADMHVKYAFKRREIVGRPRPLEVIVVNNHVGKSAGLVEEERQRFARFFKEGVRYTSISFEQFAHDPSIVEAANPVGRADV